MRQEEFTEKDDESISEEVLAYRFRHILINFVKLSVD
jgi:hypothetical protein